MIDPSDTLAAARRLRGAMSVSLVLVVALAAIVAYFGASDPAAMVRTITGSAGWDGPPPGRWQEVALVWMGLIHLGFWIALLLLARALFGRLADGDPDGAAIMACRLSRVLWGLLAWTIASGPLTSLALTLHLPEGQRALAFAFGPAHISLALAALIAGFLARAFAFGAELWRDHREVV